MSLMCQLGNQCCASNEMDTHENRVISITIIMVLAELGYWMLDWF